MDIFIQQLTNALVVGSFYSLIALGYSMVYGIIKLLNFAHGDLYMIGAFAGFSALSLLSGDAGVLGIAMAFLAAMIVAGLFGIGIERVAYRPLLNSSRLTILITAVGVSLVLENGVMLTYGPSFKVFPSQLPITGFQIAGATVTYSQIGLILLSVLLMVALQWFVHRTLYGKAMRSIAIDQTATSLMGIPVHRIIGITFFIGSALAAAAGMMAGLYYGQINFMMGFIVGLKAFTAAVIGGIGSIPGAMLGGLVLGLLETFGTIYIGGEWKDVFAFAILILILTLKPTGLLGEKVTERM
ncbi:branched-chain amino acid ABC transporter permease [Effusibacillus lacus]|uniref:Branched-chain amino acid ABC transporter permease n=1 Tax=Effusibacillus lacus TaxID=1348429 RepID=A0A292YMY2_9BACL|nr:branched-chain amino acid ABC transporter permease [Effusibacillus lacus]TCS72266.1 amino acid/amide ABC transporter membrane protein 1 (HAAT family) [Effusibacillus lacus]GAX90259.1 branched-chain amino acid ABC transporter permease [Effusibacillus lacus]